MNLKLIAISLALASALLGCDTSSKNNPAPGPAPLVGPVEETQIASGAKIEKIAEFPGQQVTGVTVSKEGRIFANFPRWREGVLHSVVEVKADGSFAPYPNEAWNKWNGEPRADGFTCVQSVIAHGDSLFVLDPSNPMMRGVVGKPTLFEFSLKTDKLLRKWEFDENVAPPLSYLNDLRVDDANQSIYITESGLGAILVLNMETGSIRRLLDKHPSTKAEPVLLTVSGKPFLKENGLPARIHADGIAMFDGYLYYHAVTGRHLYRIPTGALANHTVADIGGQVEDLGITPMPDGMIFDRKGNLIMADLEKNGIVSRTLFGEIKPLIETPNLHWADTFALDAQNNLLFTDSHLDEAAPGKPADGIKFQIYRVALPQ